MHTLILCLFSLPNVVFVFVSFYARGTKTRDLLRSVRGVSLFSKRRAPFFLCVFGKERSSRRQETSPSRRWCARLGECCILRRARVSTTCFSRLCCCGALSLSLSLKLSFQNCVIIISSSSLFRLFPFVCLIFFVRLLSLFSFWNERKEGTLLFLRETTFFFGWQQLLLLCFI